MEKKKLLSVLLPAYNEAEHIYENVLEVSRIIARFAARYEIVVVDDGSKDATYAEACRAADADAHVCAIHYAENQGKGRV